MEPVQADLTGKVAVVTGANTGMGRETARALASMGAQVVLACRSGEKAEAARTELLTELPNAQLEVLRVDLSSQASIRAFGRDFSAAHPKLDILVNNAGAWWMDKRLSVDGLELQWATNVVGPHLLTQVLLPALKAAGGRIVNVASTAAGGLDLSDVQYEKRGYSGVGAYSASKQANRMLTWALAGRLQGTGVTANALSPGLVNTELNRSTGGIFKVVFTLTRLFAKTARAGADTAVWLAASPSVAGKTNTFYENRKELPCKFRVAADVDALWSLVERQVVPETARNGERRAAQFA